MTCAVNAIALISSIASAIHTRSCVGASSSPNRTHIVSGIRAVAGPNAVRLCHTIVAHTHITSNSVGARRIAEANSCIGGALVDVCKFGCQQKKKKGYSLGDERNKERGKNESILPVQFTPLPVNPVLQLQLNDPGVLVQVA